MTIDEAFVKYCEILNFGNTGKNVEDLVDVEELKKCPCAPARDSGVAYDGALMYHVILVYHFAVKLQAFFNKVTPVEDQSLAKVVALHQLGKVGMFTPNTDNWQVQKLGKVYAFNEKSACLKTGELSKLLASNNGITFTPEEYEAMSIMDKTAEEYEAMSKHRTTLSTIVRMANDIAYTIERERFKNSTNNE